MDAQNLWYSGFEVFLSKIQKVEQRLNKSYALKVWMRIPRRGLMRAEGISFHLHVVNGPRVPDALLVAASTIMSYQVTLTVSSRSLV